MNDLTTLIYLKYMTFAFACMYTTEIEYESY